MHQSAEGPPWGGTGEENRMLQEALHVAASCPLLGGPGSYLAAVTYEPKGWLGISALSLLEMEAELGSWMHCAVMDECLCVAGAILWQSHVGRWQWLGTHGIVGKYLADIPAVRDKTGEMKC